MTDEGESKLQKIREMINKYADAKSERVFLEHFRKSKKAMLMKEAECAGIESAAKQERDAYCNQKYLQILDGLREATEIEARLYWELRVLEMRFDWARTKAANERAERQRYGA